VPQGPAAHPRLRSRSETVTPDHSSYHLSLKDPPLVRSIGDTFRLLLAFAQARTGTAPCDLHLDDLDAGLIGAFLEHLRNDRHNGARTRNARLAAIHSLFRYAALRHPEHAALIQRVLAIPPARFDKTVVSYLTAGEAEALLAAPDRSRWTGRRDHALLAVAIQTGLRVSELTRCSRILRQGVCDLSQASRIRAIAHNTKDLRCGKALDMFAPIVTRLRQMAGEFCTALDCVDVGFIPDGLLDALPAACQLGGTRVGGIDVTKPRSRAVLAAALALAIAPGGFTVADFAAKVRAMTGQADYTSRNAAYDLRKLRGKHLAGKPGCTRRYLISPGAARIISALLTLREHVIAPLLAGVADPRIRRTPRHCTDIDRHYQALRLEMMALFADIGTACG
jgi:hypothetical protein